MAQSDLTPRSDDGGNRIAGEVAADGITDHLAQLIPPVRLGENRVPEGTGLVASPGRFSHGEDNL